MGGRRKPAGSGKLANLEFECRYEPMIRTRGLRKKLKSGTGALGHNGTESQRFRAGKRRKSRI